MKLPCIVTNINGCNEIVQNEVNGFVVPVKIAVILEQYMKRMHLMQQEELQLMGSKSRDIIISKFERRFVWDCLLKEYQQIGKKPN